MFEDVRDKPSLSETDVLALNFVRSPAPYFFRRHYRAGLRSHIMEVLRFKDVNRETQGTVANGIARFPRARPLRMLRIFRTRFRSLEDAEAEVRRVKVIEAYLAPDHVARSEEFLVDYVREGQRQILLCGLQEFVEGEILDPWSPLDRSSLCALFQQMDQGSAEESGKLIEGWLLQVRTRAEAFTGIIKRMIMETTHVPDLAGVGNLLVTATGTIKLVDINNISQVTFRPTIEVDDRGYPVCDKSIEALWLLEQKLLQYPPREEDPIYREYLIPERMKEVELLAKRFRPGPLPELSDYEPS
jgi:hypothetical protein